MVRVNAPDLSPLVMEEALIYPVVSNGCISGRVAERQYLPAAGDWGYHGGNDAGDVRHRWR